ncbi:MAG: AAA family ATPase [Proteobacteria bacterium]|nr:AAA family ATPase [Pseudomonadota bacterium]
MSLKLKSVLARVGRKQSDLARALDVSDATVAQIVNHGKFPKSVGTRRRESPKAQEPGQWSAEEDKTDLKTRILELLVEAGATPDDLSGVFDDEADGLRANATRPVSTDVSTNAQSGHVNGESTEESVMLLRKQALSQQAKKHFGLFRTPFSDELESAEDLYLSPDIRYVREAMLQTAKHGGFLCVTGESGAGKSVLARDLEDRIARESQPIILIKPYVLAMEDDDSRGKTLKATHIAEAMMAAVAPKESAKSSPEARFAQLHRVLKASHTAGYRHCLLIDEAHSLPIPTIKHLKRFFELEMGFKKLTSIILIGQPELRAKLDERNQQVREVVQRCEMVELSPLAGQALNDYLRLKFDRVGKPLPEVINEGGIDALRARLTFATRRGERSESVSLLYPLAVGNVLTAAMNLAAELGSRLVTADVVKGV